MQDSMGHSLPANPQAIFAASTAPRGLRTATFDLASPRPAGSRPTLAQLSPGRRIHDRYTVLELIGSGGFAEVYRCWDRQASRDVAVKLLDLRRGGADPARAGARFHHEADATRLVNHPNVVQVFDVGLLGLAQVPFIVMELLAGQDLGEALLGQGPVAAGRLLPLFVALLEGLGAAHEAGVVHKDIKPANVFWCQPGTTTETLRLVDFGVARVAASADPRVTCAGQVVGTPQYLAPEYIQSQQISPALDVYQAGLVLAEALTGRRVVQDDNPLRCVTRHANGELELAADLMASPFGPILRRALATDPAQRFENGRAFAAALSPLQGRRFPMAFGRGPLVSLGGAPVRPRVVRRSCRAAVAPTLKTPAPKQPRLNVRRPLWQIARSWVGV